eukprot:NODE_2639_length_1373_cov_108.732000_g2507_i0.p1 GENE.NODE_2639_length_1373_cov_108.732000_g2507_i0~~NODE_2639_length_1373_cov_108.732000_g2507_i0.p1  ORF type:complete len:384 (+),score=81.31 NODE_2639_length_1373_cov_108.732000_g2507_i0:58-1152(+)
MFGEAPSVKPFTYLLIPCDKDKPVETRRFEGNDDDELRSSLASHFVAGLTVGQAESFKAHMKGQIEEQQKKQQQQQPEELKGEVLKQEAPAFDTNNILDSAAFGKASFEIVPVIYPLPTNNYIGTSLYIDQIGLFKDLPLNDRASKIAQTAIRGDAFMLRCYDDPKADEWGRVDCPMSHFEESWANPPQKAPDPETQARIQQAQQQHQLPAITPEAIDKAAEKREEGNQSYRAGKIEEADKHYSEALDMLNGDVPEVLSVRVAELCCPCWLNRAQCRLKSSRWKDVIEDCDKVLKLDPESTKAMYRRATAANQLGEFSLAMADARKGKELCPENGDFDKLIQSIQKREAAELQRQRQQFGKMFA